MKKIALILFATLATLLFAACGGKKASETEQFLADYEKWTNEIGSVMERISTGDTLAVAEYDKLAERSQDFNVKLQQYGVNFTSDQIKKYEEISSKYTEALQKMPR